MNITIQLNQHYRDVSGLWLRPGIHELDPMLAELLINDYGAVRVVDESIEGDPPDDVPATAASLGALKKADLETYAGERGIALDSSMKKTEMIQAILNHEGGA